MHFEMSSAICFNLDQSKIFSSGNRLSKPYFVKLLKVSVNVVLGNVHAYWLNL